MGDPRARLVIALAVLIVVGIALPSFFPRQPARLPQRRAASAAQPARPAPAISAHAPRDGATPPPSRVHPDRETVRRTVCAWLEPEAMAARLASAAIGTAPGAPASESPALAARTQAIADAARAYRQAFVTVNAQSEPELRDDVDPGELERALALLVVAFPDQDRSTLASELDQWTTDLALLLESVHLDASDLSQTGAEALAQATPQIAAQLERQRDELARVLRATGKPVPEKPLDLEQALSPESLARVMDDLQRAATRR